MDGIIKNFKFAAFVLTTTACRDFIIQFFNLIPFLNLNYSHNGADDQNILLDLALNFVRISERIPNGIKEKDRKSCY